jgi:hypothetical protein
MSPSPLKQDSSSIQSTQASFDLGIVAATVIVEWH